MLVTVVHICNLSYLVGGSRKSVIPDYPGQKVSKTPILTNNQDVVVCMYL
jgi:hypothetical protein